MSGWEEDPVPARFGTIRSLKVVQYKPSGDRVPSRPEICSGLRRIVPVLFFVVPALRHLTVFGISAITTRRS